MRLAAFDTHGGMFGFLAFLPFGPSGSGAGLRLNMLGVTASFLSVDDPAGGFGSCVEQTCGFS